MKRALLSIGAALALAAAALPTSANAAPGKGAAAVEPPMPAVAAAPRMGGGGGGGVRMGGGGGGFARSTPSGGGGIAMRAGPRRQSRRVQPGWRRRNFAARGGGQNFAARGARRHFRGPGVAFGLAAPYYDYATPYDDAEAYAAYSNDGDDSCYGVRIVQGAYRRVWVCE